MTSFCAVNYTMANSKTKLKNPNPSPFEERILRWSEQVRPGPPPIRISTRERKPPDRYKPPLFSQSRRVMSELVTPSHGLKRPFLGGSIVTRSSASKRTKTDSVVTQVKDLMTFKPAMYGRKPKEFLECIQQEAILMREFDQLKGLLRLHISRSTMKDNSLIPMECKVCGILEGLNSLVP